MAAALYYGHIAVKFVAINGDVIVYKHDHAIRSAESRQTSLDRLKPCGIVNNEGVIIPAIPALDIVLLNNNNSNDDGKMPHTTLDRCLMKSANGTIAGYASGIRSGLIPVTSDDDDSTATTIWYRLKGCGNNYDGFPLQSVADQVNLATIRGCAFMHTAIRELCMTAHITMILRNHGLRCGNEAVGYYAYDLNDTITTVLPEIPRVCSVFRTFGNRRLGDHVLLGLERLLPLLIDEESVRTLALANTAQPTWMKVVMEEKYVDCADTPLPMRTPPLSSSSPSSFIDGPAWLSNVWSKCMETLQQQHQSSTCAFGYLYWRFGYECGTILRLMHENSTLWGTYKDDMGHHNNAHANNLILLDDCDTQWLAPVDFDMAFTRDEFIYDNETFESWRTLECNGFRMTLAGDPDVSTGVVGGVAELSDTLQQVKWALRDTLMNAFDIAYAGGDADTLHPHDSSYASIGRALCEAALVMTTNTIA